MLHRWFNDPEVTEFLALRYPLSHHTERDFIERTSDIGYQNLSFAIETLDGTLMGGCSLENVSPENRQATLGIAIGDKAYWDGGLSANPPVRPLLYECAARDIVLVLLQPDRGATGDRKSGYHDTGCPPSPA